MFWIISRNTRQREIIRKFYVAVAMINDILINTLNVFKAIFVITALMTMLTSYIKSETYHYFILYLLAVNLFLIGIALIICILLFFLRLIFDYV